MRLRHIEVFHAVYKYGSISAAARDLNVSQPSVSKVLRHAEDQLGYDLFDRKKGRLTPTPAAHELFGEVEDVYARMRSLHQTARNIASRKGGHLRIGVLPSLGFEVLPRAIARFRDVSPETSFEIDTLHSKTLAGALIERECDIAVGYGDPARAGLVATPLGASELLLIEPRGEQAPERQGPAQFAELETVPVIGLRDSGPLGDLLTRRLVENDIDLNEVVVARTYYIALSLVRLGVGLAVVDDFTAASAWDGAIRARRFADPIECPVTAVTLDEHPHMTLISEFVQILAEVVRDRPRPWDVSVSPGL